MGLKLYLREIGCRAFELKNIDAMPSYNLFIYNQRKRVRYPEILDLPDIGAAQRVARRVATIFMDVVPYWSDLSPDQRGRYVVEIMNEAGELLLTVPFRAKRRRRLVRLKRLISRRKKPHQDCSTDGAGESQEE
jgi:hypothetical protein